MEWVIEVRRGNAHGGDRYIRRSRTGNLMWGSLRRAEVFRYASDAHEVARHHEGAAVVRLIREGSFLHVSR